MNRNHGFWDKRHKVVEPNIKKILDSWLLPDNFFTRAPPVVYEEIILSYNVAAFKAVRIAPLIFSVEEKRYPPPHTAIAYLVIPEGARVIRSRYNKKGKLRTNVAYVEAIADPSNRKNVEIYDAAIPIFYNMGNSWDKGKMPIYAPGTYIRPDTEFSANLSVSCAPGIHFFASLYEAISWL